MYLFWTNSQPANTTTHFSWKGWDLYENEVINTGDLGCRGKIPWFRCGTVTVLLFGRAFGWIKFPFSLLPTLCQSTYKRKDTYTSVPAQGFFDCCILYGCVFNNRCVYDAAIIILFNIWCDDPHPRWDIWASAAGVDFSWNALPKISQA